MLYLSEMYGRKVFTEDKKSIGNLQDLLFLPSETALITKFVINTSNKKKLTVPIQYIKSEDKVYILQDGYLEKAKEEDEMSLLHKVQNQQIVDIQGEKVIRVNDVVISDTPDYVISGLDVGVLGVFRWIYLARFVADSLRKLSIRYRSEFIAWGDIDPTEIAKERIVLKKDQEAIKKLHPVDLAEHLEHSTIHNVLRSLRVMDKKTSARVIAELNLDFRKEIFRRFSSENTAQILALIDTDDAVDVLLLLDRSRRLDILKHFDKKKKTSIEHLLKHSKTPIGHFMKTEYFEVDADTTVGSVLSKLRKEASNYAELLYVYVVNKEKQIVGVLNLHEILAKHNDDQIYKVMNQNLILGRLTTPKEIALSRLIKYHLHAMPIVDEERKILGIVALEDLIKI